MVEMQPPDQPPVHVPCECTGCGGEHHRQGAQCQGFGGDTKLCSKCKATLEHTAVAVASPVDAERKPPEQAWRPLAKKKKTS
jgi:hypothetical protein